MPRLSASSSHQKGASSSKNLLLSVGDCAFPLIDTAAVESPRLPSSPVISQTLYPSSISDTNSVVGKYYCHLLIPSVPV